MKEVRLFVDPENVGKVMNAMAEAGVTGFYVIEYRGVSPRRWEGFMIEESPEAALKALKDLSENAVMFVTVVTDEVCERLKEVAEEYLRDVRHTIVVAPVDEVTVR